MKAHKIVIVVCVTGCLLYGCNTLARWGGAAAGAGAGAVIGGPVGAAVGAVAGDAGGDALLVDPPTTTINNAPGGTVYTQEAAPWTSPLRYWPWALAVWALIRFRRHVWGFGYTLATGGLRASGANLAAILLGGSASDKAREATLTHAARRAGKRLRFVTPNPEPKVTVKPHE